jgi:drug/metabolite transporter (DMT)-like permease
MQNLGEAAAIGTALCWTGSSLFFGLAGRRVGSLPVNQFRILVAVPVLLGLQVAVAGELWPVHLPMDRFALLCASGLVGLVFGDLGYFHALAVIGPRISSVLMATWPAMAMTLAWATAGERPAGAEVAGLLLTTAGVVLVLLRAREGSAWNATLTVRQRALAVGGALLGACGQALGVALSRPAMRPGPDLPDGVEPVTATFVRLLAAGLGIMLLGLLQGRPGAFLQVVRGGALRATLLGTLFGPVVGIWLSMVAILHASSAGTAAALMATTPLFMMPVARFAYGARVGWLGLVGTLLVVGGAALLLQEAQGGRP